MNKITLQAGQLYQVKHWEKGWIIAEYVREVAAHSYKYVNLNMMTCQTSAEKTRKVPLSHQWKKIGYGSTFTIEARGMEVRPVTAEAVDTINALKAEITRLDGELTAKCKELREFCN